MVSTGVNYLAVLVAGAAYMVLGALWYSPVLFANAWMKGIGKTKEQIAKDFSPFSYVWAILTSLIASYGIARVFSYTGGSGIADGILISLLIGVCFVLTALWVNGVFEGRPRGLILINVFYHLIGLVLTGIIIGAWR